MGYCTGPTFMMSSAVFVLAVESRSAFCPLENISLCDFVQTLCTCSLDLEKTFDPVSPWGPRRVRWGISAK